MNIKEVAKVKRVLSLCLATFLAVGLLGSSAFAGQVTGVVPTEYAFVTPNTTDHSVLAQASTDGNFYIQLGASALTTSDGSSPFTSVSDLYLLGLQPSSDADNTEFTDKFIGIDYAVDNGGNGYLVLKPKSFSTDTSFAMTMGLRHKDFLGISTQPQKISGTIKASGTTPGTGAITGYRTFTPYAISETISIGTPLYYDILTSNVFTFDSTTNNTVTKAKLTAAGITVESTNTNNITASIVDDSDGTARLMVSANTTNTGSQSGSILLKSTNSTIGSVTLATFNYTITTGSTTGNKITGIDPNARLGEESNGIWGRTGRNGSALPSGESLSSMTIKPGDIITFEFNSDFFNWEKGKPSPNAWVNRSAITNGKITVKRTGSSSGTNLIDTLEMRYDNNRAYVYLKFKDNITTTKDQDFSFDVALYYNNRTESGTEATVGGTMSYDYIPVYRDDEHVDISGGEIAEAEEAVPKVDVYIGEGVTITVRMTKGKQYKGSVSLDPTTSDNAVLDKYPDIEYCYTLTTTGLSQTGNIVSFDLGETYYAYDKDVKYLGQTNTKLPYSTKYYLSTKRLDVDTDVQGSGDVVEVPNGTTTPGPTTGNNGNYNPATGR